MTKSPAQPAIRAHRLRPEEVWNAIRSGWEAGETASAVGRLHDVPVSTVLGRSKREGWVRKPPPPLPEPTVVRPLRDGLEIAEAALAGASEALQRGRPAEAMAIIKAGDAVGAFADFVQRLRLDAGVAGACSETQETEAKQAGSP